MALQLLPGRWGLESMLAARLALPTQRDGSDDVPREASHAFLSVGNLPRTSGQAWTSLLDDERCLAVSLDCLSCDKPTARLVSEGVLDHQDPLACSCVQRLEQVWVRSALKALVSRAGNHPTGPSAIMHNGYLTV